MGAFAGLVMLASTVWCLYFWIDSGVEIPKTALIIDGFAFVTCAQFFLTAMHMDYQYNENLCVMLSDARSKAGKSR